MTKEELIEIHTEEEEKLKLEAEIKILKDENKNLKSMLGNLKIYINSL